MGYQVWVPSVRDVVAMNLVRVYGNRSLPVRGITSGRSPQPFYPRGGRMVTVYVGFV